MKKKTRGKTVLWSLNYDLIRKVGEEMKKRESKRYSFNFDLLKGVEKNMLELNKIHCMDCLEGMKKLPDNSVDSIVTDPPYGLSFMGKKWDYDVPSVEIWKEALRVLKPGGHLLSFGGTRTYHRMVVNIEDAGFEIRDQIQWLYGSGFPKSLNIGKQIDKMAEKDLEVIEAKEWEGWGTALKPANEPICVARKPLSEKNVSLNVLKWGTGGLNIDESRIGTEVLKEHKSGKIPNDRGEWGINEGYVMKERQGRFPANVILDKEAGEMLGEQKRFFYCAKASKSERNKGLEDLNLKAIGKNTGNNHHVAPLGRETTYKNNHPTVKPLKLMKYLVNLVTKKGGIVLDPFSGSGTTCLASQESGMKFMGFELSEEYCKIANKRLEQGTLI